MKTTNNISDSNTVDSSNAKTKVECVEIICKAVDYTMNRLGWANANRNSLKTQNASNSVTDVAENDRMTWHINLMSIDKLFNFVNTDETTSHSKDYDIVEILRHQYDGSIVSVNRLILV